MTEAITAYPLTWPAGWPRTDRREYGRFGTRDNTGIWPRNKAITVHQARVRIESELARLDGRGNNWERIDPDSIVLSTNLALRLDGQPRSDQKAPEDPGAALYFTMDGKPQCIPCDSYTKVEQNMAAIASTIEALRALERHGSGLMARAFTGFTALPPPDQVGEAPWYSVLGVPPKSPQPVVKAAYRKLCSETHPDKPGGSSEAFDRVQKAWQQYIEQRAA